MCDSTDLLAIPTFLCRKCNPHLIRPITPNEPIMPSSRIDWKPSAESIAKQNARDEREREATLARWNKEWLAEQIADQKKKGE